MPLMEKTTVRIDFTIASGNADNGKGLVVPADGMDDAAWEGLLHRIRSTVDDLRLSYGHLPGASESTR